MRLIDADEVKRQIDEWLDIVGCAYVGKGLSYYGELLGCIEDTPTIDAVPVVHGHWIPQNDGLTRFMCSNCKIGNQDGFGNYCRHCGAKMDGKAV